jgi:hypothetical protein
LATGSALTFNGTNLGIGVTPSAYSSGKVIEVGTVGNAVFGIGAADMRIISGAYYNSGSGGWIYTASGTAISNYGQTAGSHLWYTAPSGTAGTLATFTQAMTLNASGNLSLGTTSTLNYGAGGTYKNLSIDGGTSADARAEISLAGGGGGANYNLGRINFGLSSNTTHAAAGINAFSSAAGSSTGGILSFSTASDISSGAATESMRISSQGYVGIGTSSPNRLLSLYATQPVFQITNVASGNTQGTIQYQVSGSTDFILDNQGSGSGGNILFYQAGAERARLPSTGGFSVGTSSAPGAGAIYATGNITAYYSSDIKFKENVRDIPDALATVNAIGGKLFDWKDDYIESKGGADGYFVQKADFGVVAQDVQKVFPIAVRTREDGSLAVDYEKLGALAFAALVELTKRVEALETK